MPLVDTSEPMRDLDPAAFLDPGEAGRDIHHVSARTGAGVDEAFAELAGRMPGRPAAPPDALVTARP